MAEQKEDGVKKKRRKINSMTLAEVEAELAKSQDKQGGLISKYARQLLARKKALSG